jgi:hypothetical protein
MKNKSRNKAYSELDERLKVHLANSTNSVHIDEDAKNKIWNNLSEELHEKQLEKTFRVRRTYKVAITVCIMMVVLVSVDLSSNASLFKRLLTNVSGNIIQMHSRNSEPYEEERDVELDAKVAEINEINDKVFISPALPDGYTLQNIDYSGGNILLITLLGSDNNFLNITQKDASKNETGTSASYNQNQFEKETYNNNGIEYTILRSDSLIIGIFVKGDIEVEIIGMDYSVILDTIISLQR